MVKGKESKVRLQEDVNPLCPPGWKPFVEGKNSDPVPDGDLFFQLAEAMYLGVGKEREQHVGEE